MADKLASSGWTWPPTGRRRTTCRSCFGEGWVGYTPLHGRFEEGPVGAEICRLGRRRAAGVGAWGTVVCSNAAPQHPMWSDVALQQECNETFRDRCRARRLLSPAITGTNARIQ